MIFLSGQIESRLSAENIKPLREREAQQSTQSRDIENINFVILQMKLCDPLAVEQGGLFTSPPY